MTTTNTTTNNNNQSDTGISKYDNSSNGNTRRTNSDNSDTNSEGQSKTSSSTGNNRNGTDSNHDQSDVNVEEILGQMIQEEKVCRVVNGNINMRVENNGPIPPESLVTFAVI